MAKKPKHLWSAKHPYYCSESNYFCNSDSDPNDSFESWADFHAEYHDADYDMNHIFRFDWYEGGFGGSKFKGDVNYRNGELRIFWMLQRKGIFRVSTIKVCRADEPGVIQFLAPRYHHLQLMWAPISDLVGAP